MLPENSLFNRYNARMRLDALFVTLFVLFFATPFTGVAQIIPDFENPIELEVVPANPAPNQNVVVRAHNVAGSLGTTSFVWRVNGRIVDQGIGIESIRTQTGNIGSATSVEVSITDESGSTVERSVVLRPASLEIVWEANTYTPPFYVGRPLPNGESAITILAVPNVVQGGSRVSASNMVYRWYVGSSQSPYRSGYGVNTVTVTPPQFENTFFVRVVAETRDGSVRAEGTTQIVVTRPRVAIYERAPLLGIRFDQATMAETTLSDDEKTFVAFPLYVNNLDIPDYTWTVGGREATQTGRTERELTLRRENDAGGQVRVSFVLKNVAALFEEAQESFLLNF